MGVRVGINGFGRIGRLALWAAWGWPELEFAHVNEIGGDAVVSAHLLSFDSVHGRWVREARGEGTSLEIDGRAVGHSSIKDPGVVPWGDAGVDTVSKVIQLGIEYDPHPPFRSGSPRGAGWLTRAIAHLAMRRYDSAARPDE